MQDPEQSHFGTNGHSALEAFMISQQFKVPSLRNLYQKVGAFGGGTPDEQGPQVRGFGLLHDGSRGSFRNFLQTGTAASQRGEEDILRALEEFIFVFPTNMAPIVGQQVTLHPDSPPTTDERIDLLVARASRSGREAECDLVVHGVVDGVERGWIYTGDGVFRGDRLDGAPFTDALLRALARNGRSILTYTALPPGSGVRAAVDRDEDGALDADERDAGTDPADAASTPGVSFARADCNGDRRTDLSDAVRSLTFLFAGEAAAAPGCLDACDANDDGSLDISDGIYTLRFLFLGGAELPGPFGECGLDPTGDTLDCRDRARC